MIVCCIDLRTYSYKISISNKYAHEPNISKGIERYRKREYLETLVYEGVCLYRYL